MLRTLPRVITQQEAKLMRRADSYESLLWAINEVNEMIRKTPNAYYYEFNTDFNCDEWTIQQLILHIEQAGYTIGPGRRRRRTTMMFYPPQSQPPPPPPPPPPSQPPPPPTS